MHPEDLQTPAVRLREPAVDFPHELLDRPEDIAREELQAVLGRAVSPEDTRRLFLWHLSRQHADSAAEWTVLERVLLWIGGARPADYRATGQGDRRPSETEAEISERRVGLRAAIALAEFVPHGQHAYSTRSLAKIFGVSHGEVFRLRQNLRAITPAQEPI
jgi:PAS domain-containing protein